MKEHDKPNPALRWPIVYGAVDLIAEFEQGPMGGYAPDTYRCAAGVLTIGWGDTDKDKAKPGARCTKDEADRWLLNDLNFRASQVRELLTDYTTPNQMGALVSLAYNIGLTNFGKSTVLKAHNRGDLQAAADAFELWNKAKNPRTGELRVLAGLARRRKAEAALYLTPEAHEPPQRGAQAVMEPQKPAESARVRTGAVVSMAGAAGLVADLGPNAGTLAQAAQSVRSFALDTLGLPVQWFGPALVVGVGGFLIWHWWRDRRRGWV